MPAKETVMSKPSEPKSTDSTNGPPPAHTFSLREMSVNELDKAIRIVPLSGNDEEPTTISIRDFSGQHGVLMRLNRPLQINGEGPLGDYAFAFNQRTEIRLTGDVGHGVGDGLQGGAVRIRGNAGCGAGAAMTGGTLAVYGSVGPRCGAGMRGGGIFVRGNVGEETGVGALRGMIVIGGNAGSRLGDAMSNVTIFIRGRAESLAEGVVEAPLRKREQLRLGLLLINASIRGQANDFRRIVPRALLKAEQAQRGEIVPNWR